MSNMEEKLWEYIDGGGTPAEREHMARLLEQDGQLQQQYEELLQLHTDFATIDLDEPPMAFTYNVMETIRTQEAAVPLKAGINPKIIWSIAAFFGVAIVGLLVVILGSVQWSSGVHQQAPTLPINIQLNVNQLFNGDFAKGFLFFDVVLALFLGDAWLRKRNRQPLQQDNNLSVKN